MPFETIDNAEGPPTTEYYKVSDPKLAVLYEEGALNEILSFVSPEAQTALQSLDYKQFIVIAVFQGRRSTSGYRVEIQDITRQGNRIVISAHFTEHDPNFPASLIVTSHII